jgi:uncharacterized Fe-S cluster-containing radical SAM superfamily protein
MIVFDLYLLALHMLGCNLNCGYCWVPDERRIGHGCQVEAYAYQPPEDTYALLKGMAIMHHIKQVRISGCEPLINEEHLLKVIKWSVADKYQYVLDTNGTLLTEKFLDKLEPYKRNIYMYFGLKGATSEHFHNIAYADEKLWHKQIEALRMINRRGYTIGLNLMSNLTPPEILPDLFETLHHISPWLPAALDMKRMTYFPHIARRLKKLKAKLYKGIVTKTAWDKILAAEYDTFPQIEYNNGLKFVVAV